MIRLTTEPARQALDNRLGEVLGPEYAETLMTSLPLQPANELATKSDIARLETKIDDLAVEIKSELREMRRALRNHQIATIGAMTALTGIFSLIVGLIT